MSLKPEMAKLGQIHPSVAAVRKSHEDSSAVFKGKASNLQPNRMGTDLSSPEMVSNCQGEAPLQNVSGQALGSTLCAGDQPALWGL